MRAEVIAIGDELITGQRLDTNTQWLSERLNECGLEVAFHTTVGDVLDDNVRAFRNAIDRADFVVCTGGLGPTADDLTREALAAAARVGLVRDAESLAYIERLFAERGRQMPDSNKVQADFPAGAIPVANLQGTAPGIQLTVARQGRAPCVVFALPGVPAELKPMWHDSVAPAILALRPQTRVIRHRRVKCFGVGESKLESMLPDLIRRGREPSVGITVSDATITLRITAAGPDEAACLDAMAPTINTIRQMLGDLVFGDEDDELQHAVARLLNERSQNVAVAEWATSGRISEWFGEVGGDLSRALVAGVTVSALQPLALNAVTGSTTDDGAPHSSATATALAESVRRWANADYGLGVAAFPAEPDAPDARVHVTIAGPGGVQRLRFGCASHPAIRKSRTAKQALNALRLILLGRKV